MNKLTTMLSLAASVASSPLIAQTETPRASISAASERAKIAPDLKSCLVKEFKHRGTDKYETGFDKSHQGASVDSAYDKQGDTIHSQAVIEKGWAPSDANLLRIQTYRNPTYSETIRSIETNTLFSDLFHSKGYTTTFNTRTGAIVEDEAPVGKLKGEDAKAEPAMQREHKQSVDMVRQCLAPNSP